MKNAFSCKLKKMGIQKISYNLKSLNANIFLMNLSYFDLSCPLIPLLPKGKGYPEGFKLPKRQRNADALDLPKLTNIFRESVIFEASKETSNSKKSNLCVLSVLSPYSLLTHVMITELSQDRFLPGPESFHNDEWEQISVLAMNVIKKIDILTKQNENLNLSAHTICCGFNWSPYSWGEFEEKGGCQSITTKFHLMIWQWPLIIQNRIKSSWNELPKKHRLIFFENLYNAPFARLLARELSLSEFECNPRGLFVPIEQIDVELLIRIKRISEAVQLIIHRLNSILIVNYSEAIQRMQTLMQQTEKRIINEDEINSGLRYNHLEVNSFEQCMSLCQNEDEKIIIKSIYQAVLNRIEMNKDRNPDHFIDKSIWEKFFGFSLVIAETKSLNDKYDSSMNAIRTGLYISLHPLCGPGGCAELLGCHLIRPEAALANEQIMINHNNEIWNLYDLLNNMND